MTQALKDLWKKNFPAWPDALIEKFSDQIVIELNAYDSNTGKDVAIKFSEIVNSVDRKFTSKMNGSYNVYGEIYLFNPSNEKYKIVRTWDSPAKYYYETFVPVSDGVGYLDQTILNQWNSIAPKRAVQFHLKLVWDDRLFFGPDYDYSYFTKRVGENVIIGDMFTIQAYPAESFIEFTMLNKAKPYSQNASLIALSENGVKIPGIDYVKTSEFLIYLNSYKNYSQQIAGSADVAKKTAAADLQNYKADLDSKLLAQKNALQNLTLQLTTQTQGQADSVRRDMQQLNLQAVGLKLQILGLMKK